MKVAQLRTVIDTAGGMVRAVDGISFELLKGECFALVGESGSGKSMTALSLMRLLPDAARIAGGQVELEGVDLLGLPEAAMRAVRGRRVAMIFQEPSTPLNPVLTVGRQITEVIERHGAGAGDRRKRAVELLRSRVAGEPVEMGKRTSPLWTPRYFVRRSAWHALDHAWEIEDRAERE